ncbi:MAG: hypothetical protein IAE87_14110 [Rhodobacteraceae bacterium]|nr:hypothetical protein [Paracoccaceae bacterium]
MRLLVDALAEIDRVRNTLTRLLSGLEGAIEPALNEPSSPLSDPASWRAAHRSGTPSKIEADAELRAFIVARITSQTYDQIVASVAATFPPERRISRSSLSRWFRRQRLQPVASQSADTGCHQKIPIFTGRSDQLSLTVQTL